MRSCLVVWHRYCREPPWSGPLLLALSLSAMTSRLPKVSSYTPCSTTLPRLSLRLGVWVSRP
jgi:hypothetical protein